MGINLSLKDVSDLLLKINDSINFYWNFYIVSMVTLTTVYLSHGQLLSHSVKVFLTIGLLCFFLMNLTALCRCYTFLFAVSIELKEMATPGNFRSNSLYDQLRKLSFVNRKRIACGTCLFSRCCGFISNGSWHQKLYEYLRTT